MQVYDELKVLEKKVHKNKNDIATFAAKYLLANQAD